MLPVVVFYTFLEPIAVISAGIVACLSALLFFSLPIDHNSGERLRRSLVAKVLRRLPCMLSMVTVQYFRVSMHCSIVLQVAKVLTKLSC